MDFIGPRTWNKEKYEILVVIDHHTRFLMARPLRQTTTRDVIEAFTAMWIPLMGVPKRLLMDNGPSFDSREFEEYVTRSLNVEYVLTHTYYPQGNGLNEASHKLLEHAIAAWTGPTNATYEEVVAWAAFVHNSVPCEGTKESPINLLTGHDPCWPGFQHLHEDLDDVDRHRLLGSRKEAAEFMRRLREMKVENIDHVIEVNDWVLVELNTNDKLTEHHSGCQKYKPKWGLPQRVVEVRNHSALLAPVFTRTPREWQPLTKLRLLHKDIPKQMMSLLPLLIKTNPKIDWKGLHDELPEFLSPEDFFQTPTSGGSVPSAPFLSRKRRALG
eukprot:Blabericola_migrator_1__5705@NODE_2898_length_2228_cov_36_885238_g1819_i0_p1_GENE_NODE_2898_length_2228_cov_36_885238_g1819_i0NODE_2898_length_2228_cov_36_885238_g1819_i0_p1_ORF_typecomplete_len328_score46_33rve/PF00665_26/1_3e18DDE_2/PF02914_15/0_00013_NODE_2898_length_2228_cov_36_885238_g1819_i010502033